MNMLNLIPNKTFQWRAQEGRWMHDADIYAYRFFFCLFCFVKLNRSFV